MADFFIRRPIVAMVIAILTVIVGIISLLRLPISEYPPVSPTMIQVTTTYRGAAAEAVMVSAGQSFNPFIMLPIVLFPITTGSVVLRSFILRNDYVISRTILYGVLTLMAVFGYVALTMGVSMAVAQYVAFTNPWLVAIAVLGSVYLFTPVRERFQQRIDAAFFKSARAYQERTKEFTRLITSRVDTASILRVLRENIQTALIPERVHLYSYDAINDQYVAAPDEAGRASSGIRFASNSPLPRCSAKKSSRCSSIRPSYRPA